MISSITSSLRSMLRKGNGTALTRPFTPRTSGYRVVDSTVKLEEEKMPAFSRKLYYAVNIGETYNGRYQIITKLRFGSNSTVWLCVDQRDNAFVALKIYISSQQASREVQVLKELAQLKSKHNGQRIIRAMLDSFEIVGPSGSHICLVHEPLLMSLQSFQFLLEERTLPMQLFKAAVYDVLLALDYLHTEADMIHTDIQANNIMLSSRVPQVFSKMLEAEENEPSPRKTSGDYTVYQSRGFMLDDIKHSMGALLLCDFGETRKGALQTGLIQPDLFRAPEVVLGISWTFKADIWNVGVMAWSLFEDHFLFENRDETGKHSNAHLLAHMIAILGPPPIEFIQRSKDRSLYWTEDGTWKGEIDIPDDSLEDSEEYLLDEELNGFLAFFRKILRWVPEERLTARELLQDPWLCSGS